ncbi:MAG: immunoglobulin domain-containing protein [Oceanipulchritudo sp.]
MNVYAPTISILTLLVLAGSLSAMSSTLPHPYTRADPYTNLYGDPTRGPEPEPGQIELPLPDWDEARAQATCNQGNPYDDYGHYRLKDGAWRVPYIIEEGNDAWDMTQAELDAAAALFRPTTDWGDGNLVKYQVLAPPDEAPMPANGWPLVVYCPGSGAVGRTSFVSWTVSDEVVWGSSYYREHYPAYVLVFHPQIRTVNYPDLVTTTTSAAFDAYLEVIDDIILNNPIDQSRIYTLGFSMGGSTVWQMLLQRPDFFAATAPAAGRPLESGNATQAAAVKDNSIWMMIGNQDPWQGSAKYIATFQDLEDAGATQVRFWEVQDMAHVDHPMVMYHLPEWMFAQVLGNTVPPEAPTVLLDPVSQTVTEGASVSFSASFTGVPFPTVQWKKGGVDIPRATGFTYVIPVVSLSDAGDYTAVATNSEGSVSTAVATLTVNADLTPPSVESVAATSATEVAVFFSEEVEAGTGTNGAGNTGNYALSGGLSVLAASLQPDNRTVLLTVSLMQQGNSYTLTTSGINDRATTPNASLVQNLPFTFSGAMLVHIDFNDPGSAPTGNWNIIADAVTASGLIDFSTGVATDIGISFSGGVNGGSSDITAWDDRSVSPPWADAVTLDDRFYISENGSGSMTLTGLIPGTAYNIELASGYGGDGTSGDDDGIYELTDADGLVEGFNAYTDESLGTSVAWTPRGPSLGGVEGWLAWYNAVAKPDGTLSWALSVPSGSNPRVALNAMRVASVISATPVEPEVVIFHAGGSDFTMTFPTENGFTYILERNTTDPGDAVAWSDVAGQSVTGDGTSKQLTGSMPGGGRVFFRVRVE